MSIRYIIYIHCIAALLGSLNCLTTYYTVPPLEPTVLIATNVYSTSAQLNWTIPRVTFGFETYSIIYGLSPDNLIMLSDIVAGALDSSVQNVTYSIILENLQPLTTYYYKVLATNLAGETISDIESFTTRKI